MDSPSVAVLPTWLHCCVGAKFSRTIPAKPFVVRSSLVSAAALDGVGCVVDATIKVCGGAARAAVAGLFGPSELGEARAVCAPVSTALTRAKVVPITALEVLEPETLTSRMSMNWVADAPFMA